MSHKSLYKPPNIFNDMMRIIKIMNKNTSIDPIFTDLSNSGFVEKNGIYIYKLKISKDDVKHTKIDIKKNILTVKYRHSTEHKSSKNKGSYYSSSTRSMSSSIAIPIDGNTKNIKAVYKNGFLCVIMKKK